MNITEEMNKFRALIDADQTTDPQLKEVVRSLANLLEGFLTDIHTIALNSSNPLISITPSPIGDQLFDSV